MVTLQKLTVLLYGVSALKLLPPGFQTRRLGEDREQGGEVKSNEDLFYENNTQAGFGYHRQRGKEAPVDSRLAIRYLIGLPWVFLNFYF